MEENKQDPQDSPKILSFEEFIKIDIRYPKYNNFVHHFTTSEAMLQKMYREKPYIQKFTKENKKLYENLVKKVDERIKKYGNTLKAFKPTEKLLYQAYTIIKSYEVSDEELFA